MHAVERLLIAVEPVSDGPTDDVFRYEVIRSGGAQAEDHMRAPVVIVIAVLDGDLVHFGDELVDLVI